MRKVSDKRISELLFKMNNNILLNDRDIADLQSALKELYKLREEYKYIV